MRLFMEFLRIRGDGQAAIDERIEKWLAALPEERELTCALLTAFTVEMHGVASRAGGLADSGESALHALVIARRRLEKPPIDGVGYGELVEAMTGHTAFDFLEKLDADIEKILSAFDEDASGGS